MSVIIRTILCMHLLCNNFVFAQSKSNNTTIHIHFNHVVDNIPLVLDDSLHLYHNEHGDNYYVTLFKYYISEIQLYQSDGGVINIKNDPILINVRDTNSFNYLFENIPTGMYNKISFLIGVDSLKNYDEVQDGVLDPANGMYWSWKSGYVFLKMEGVSANSTNRNGRLFFHIGGVLAPYNTLRKLEHTFEISIHLNANGTNNLTINTNINGLFFGTKTIEFAKLSATMEGGESAMTIADNYMMNLFTFNFSN